MSATGDAGKLRPSLALWVTAVWSGTMTMVAMPQLLPLAWSSDVRSAMGVASGWMAMMLIAWPSIHVTHVRPFTNRGFGAYAAIVAALGCLVFGLMQLTR